MDGETLITDRIIGCAIEVHRHLGPGLLESVYESALCVEFRVNSLPFKRQTGIPLYYKGELISEHRPDLIVDDKVVVEVKSVEGLAPIHVAQNAYLSESDVTSSWADSEFQQFHHETGNAKSRAHALTHG